MIYLDYLDRPTTKFIVFDAIYREIKDNKYAFQ